MIRFEHVSFQYEHGKKILNDLSLEFRPHGRYCLSAPSGKGKSTVFRLAAGLEKPDSGRITGMEGKTVSAVFQDDRLIPWKTVLENISLFSSLPEEQIINTLRLLGLDGTENMLPKELSGGMGRRVALARALCHESDILILDEVFTGLDEETRKQCLSVTDELIQDRTLLMASHELSDAEALHAEIMYI